MTWRNRLAAIIAPERRSSLSLPALTGFASNAMAINARAAENLSAVTACTAVVAGALSSLPALVYQRDGTGRREVTDHPIAKLLRGTANAHQTGPDFLESWIASALLTGNGLAAIERDGANVTGLRFIPWAWVSVSQLTSGRLAYDITEQVGAVGRAGRTYRLLDGEVLHLRDRSDDGLIGRSRLSRAADTVAAAMGAAEFSKSFLANGAQPSGVIEYPGAITPEQKENIRQSFDQRFAGTANAGRAMILDGGLVWKSASVSPEDAELLATRKFGVEEICRIFQVPPPLVQDYSHNTFTNSETAGRWFAQFTLGPWARKIEAEFARSVFPTGGPFELELDLSGFLRGDPQTRWAAHKIAVDSGILDADEVREIEGFNPRGKPAVAVA
jgi:HK97 family phage portal protein